MLSKRYVNVLLLFVDENFEDSRSSIFFFKSRSRTMTADMGEISMDALTQIMNGNEYKERKLLMVQYLQLSFASQKRASGVYAAKLVHYHASCVELLAECAGGNNASNISKCLEILPFETVAAVLSEIDSCPCYPVLRAFAIFMVNVYILPPASDISQTDSVLDSPVLYEILTKICRVVAAVETMQWTQWSEGEGLRSFLFDGALSLFITFLFAETEILDSRKAEIATSVQRLIQHLQGIASEIFTDQEISKIDAVAQKIGMPMCNVPNQKSREEVIDKEAKFIVENPLKRQKSKKESQLKTAKRDHDESITWGDSNLRFSQLPYLLKTCPFISDLKDAEIDQFVNFILKTYQGDDDTESGGSTIDNDNTIDLLSEKASSRGEDKRPKESGTPSLSVRSKTARNNHQSKSNFVATVSRFIKFAREEIDVIVSKDEGDRNDIVRESLDKIKRANAYQAFNIAGSDMDELTAEHTKHSVHLISGNDDVSKNIPFVLKILARCIEHFAKKGILSEHGKTPRSMLSLSTNAVISISCIFSACILIFPIVIAVF